MALASANPVLHKSSMELQFAGTGLQNPILSGFAARLTLSFAVDETLISWRVFTDTGFEKNLPVIQDTEGATVTADILHGTDSLSSVEGQRNFIEWVTNRGTTRRQFFVKDLPSTGSLYIENQECQESEAIIFASIDGDGPVTENNENAANVSLSINILPNFADEFFTLHNFSGNRFANTRRAWGGAATASFFIDGVTAIAEKPIEDLTGFFWETRPLEPPANLPVSYGQHTVTVRLRAKSGSANAIDIEGVIRIRQIPSQA